jgi:hypothetical protein
MATDRYPMKRPIRGGPEKSVDRGPGRRDRQFPSSSTVTVSRSSSVRLYGMPSVSTA